MADATSRVWFNTNWNLVSFRIFTITKKILPPVLCIDSWFLSGWNYDSVTIQHESFSLVKHYQSEVEYIYSVTDDHHESRWIQRERSRRDHFRGKESRQRRLLSSPQSRRDRLPDEREATSSGTLSPSARRRPLVTEKGDRRPPYECLLILMCIHGSATASAPLTIDCAPSLPRGPWSHTRHTPILGTCSLIFLVTLFVAWPSDFVLISYELKLWPGLTIPPLLVTYVQNGCWCLSAG